jgi:N-hydroxyarylamine O-acetyltransferase
VTAADLLAAYFARIGYTGDSAPTLKVLGELAERHLQAIPFESLGPLLGHGVDIAPQAIFAKLVASRRGGYCFEQNSLFHDVLAALDFRITPLAARVVWQLPANSPVTARSHRLTQVDIAGETFIADVGFGGQSPSVPLRLAMRAPQPTAHGTYRIVEHTPGFELQIETLNGFAGMYRFTLEPQSPADYEMGNWFTSTYPPGRFTQNLVAAIIADGGRWTLLNRQLAFRRSDGSLDERLIANEAELGGVLAETFRIDLPVDAQTIWNKLPPVS